MRQSLTVQEVALVMLGLALRDGGVRVGFVASSRECAALTGFAVAEELKALGVTGLEWSAVHLRIRWPNGASAAFLSGRNPDRVRCNRWAAAFAVPEVVPHVGHELHRVVTPGGVLFLQCGEIASRGHLQDFLAAAS